MADKQTLLCIDDDPSILKVFGKHFTRKGFDVFLAEDGEKGLDVFYKKNPDIVLVDLKMPEVSGLEVLETITKESPDTPIVIISGEGEMTDVIQALRHGAWNYHAKPIESFSILDHTVNQALEKAHLIKENKAYQKGLEKKLGNIVENFPGFVFACDENHRIIYANPALEKYVGHPVIGTTWHHAVLGLEGACPLCADDTIMIDDIIREEIKSLKDGRWFDLISVPIMDRAGRFVERQVILHDITEQKRAMLDLQEREEYLRKENIRLRATLTDRYKFGKIIGKSKPMQEVYDIIINAAASNANVIIYGESGTGKELVAKAIHENSDRQARELVYVNCGAIPENLIESEFFGYKKGAFTGASTDKHGFLDIADGGTVFLDEIGEIPMNLQVKLLRAIEGSGYMPIGGTELKKPDARFIAATNRNLKEMVKQGLMRQDFLYRIHIIPIYMPPLRDRSEDIPLLIDHFLKDYEEDIIPPLTPRVLAALQAYEWPGNVRELQNTIHRFVTLKKLDFIGLDFSESTTVGMLEGIDIDTDNQPLSTMLEGLEKKILLKFLEKNNWQRGKTADELHIGRKTLYRKMNQYSIQKPSLR